MNFFESLGGRGWLLGGVLVVVAALSVVVRARDSRARTVDGGDVLTAADLGADLGSRATLVQVSARVCGQCATLRRILAAVAAQSVGVAHVEVLAEESLDVVRRLDVVRTPTLFVLDATGRVRSRASGVPARAEIEAALRGAEVMA